MYTIYGADWCSQCKNAVKFLLDREIEFSYVDVEYCSDPIVKTFKSLPQTYFEDNHLGGLNELIHHVKFGDAE